VGQIFHGLRFDNLKGDLFGGLTAAIVALPLALAFGVASGLGPIAGLYGAIATGFFAALFGGTPSQVSGPTGPMTVVMGAIVASHAGNLPEAFAIVILGGILQIVFGFARLGRYISFTPVSVVSGFMSGIGVIIILIEILPFLGLPTAPGGPLGAIKGLAGLSMASINMNALLIAVLSLGIVIFWPAGFRKFLPSPLAALIAGTLTAAYLLTGVPVIGEVPTGLPDIHLPSFALSNLAGVVQGGFILALLGSIDSLLTSLVADSITRTRHNSDRELVGQGIGNIVAGLIGGIPGAGATMRTVVNVRAGGRTPISGAFHAVVLLALALGLGPLAAMVPHAVLAGILLKVGVDIIDWGYLKRLKKVPREKAFVMLATLFLTVFVDLITAVAVGIILAMFVNARARQEEELKGLSHASAENGGLLGEAERKELRKAGGKVTVTHLQGSFSYASAREMAHRVGQNISGCKAVVYDFSGAGHIDPSTALAIDDLFAQAPANGQMLFIAGLSGAAEKALISFGALERVAKERIFGKRLDAIKAAVRAVSDST